MQFYILIGSFTCITYNDFFPEYCCLGSKKCLVVLRSLSSFWPALLNQLQSISLLSFTPFFFVLCQSYPGVSLMISCIVDPSCHLRLPSLGHHSVRVLDSGFHLPSPHLTKWPAQCHLICAIRIRMFIRISEFSIYHSK